MNDFIYDIALSYDESITPIEKIALFNKYSSSKNILSLNKSTIRNILGRRWTGNRFLPDVFINKAKKISNYLDKAGIKFLRFDDGNYPFSLKMIPDLPFIIYYRGNISYDYNKSIAVVGTRNPDLIGINKTKNFVEELVNRDHCIISGLAHGIDASSHYHCLVNKGKTIAVLGCGIDKIYPCANTDLAGQILRNDGGIISEYPPGIKPNKWNFPKRNRIIVGLSRGVLIIQAPSKSGSLITAMLSADYDRELFVVSYKKYNNNNLGNKELILNGANEAKNPKNIVYEY